MVALLKKRCGSISQFLQAPAALLDKQQIKLETLFKSLSIHYKRLRIEQQKSAQEKMDFFMNSRRHPSRQLFEPTY